jgi:hypothetical protein
MNHSQAHSAAVSAANEPQSLADRLKAHVLLRAPPLSHDKYYELAEICSQAFWDGLSHGDKISAGSKFSMLVAQKVVPFVAVGKTGSNHKLYRRKARKVRKAPRSRPTLVLAASQP